MQNDQSNGTKPKSNKALKIILVIIAVLAFLVYAGNEGKEDRLNKTSDQNKVTQETKQANVPVTVTSTPNPIEKFNITVTSQTVKKVSKKYRYFFSIQNQSEKDFNGKIVLEGKTGAGFTVISIHEDYTKQPLAAGLARSVYSDANTAPKAIYGENGADKYHFVATVNGQEVAVGDGAITDKLEDSGF